MTHEGGQNQSTEQVANVGRASHRTVEHTASTYATTSYQIDTYAMNRVQITNLEDTRKLVAAWLKVDAHVESVDEDTDDNILWMTLTSRLGRLQLRRDCYPLNLTSTAEDVYNTLDKIPGSPYRVEDNSTEIYRGEDRDAVIVEYDRLWHKYWNTDWKRLDFLLASRAPASLPDPVKLLLMVTGAMLATPVIVGVVILAAKIFTR